ncbi:uncharacterized protein ASCRUDRAFT_80330 [Ascoidea rubescens DSM 1968]|uniref:Zinc finger C2H2 LYAR-type domain-containing protein n=1 Tax=Ascoidea rubescens DSM 1968 TaxID=1344418 RepID=A0A1D2VK58_9ASCO|nr:hypothetical protein ASCRUDRAFT_80330 [Ascoidea rubescens DSM 1968]ODV61996.1 hypothetical protein ASCRUDRAFT_80330 [Ascoidea rubescens DSM 1968]
MVSFSCEVCNDTIIKKKLDNHKRMCYGAYFTCIDCSKTFEGNDYRKHTSCVTEDEKYQKALYKPKKNGNNIGSSNNNKTLALKTNIKNASNTINNNEQGNKSKQLIIEEFSKKSKKPKSKHASKPDNTLDNITSFVSSTKNESLYKIIKKITKKNKKENKKSILKKLKVIKNTDGSLTISI